MTRVNPLTLSVSAKGSIGNGTKRLFPCLKTLFPVPPSVNMSAEDNAFNFFQGKRDVRGLSAGPEHCIERMLLY